MSKNKKTPALVAEFADKATAQKLNVKIAESFTGGHNTKVLTAYAGASVYLSESIVCYSLDSKQKRLGVSKEVLEEYSAVSITVLRAMLNGLLADDCDLAIAATGYAGPPKDRQEGVAYVGAATKHKIKVKKVFLKGTRLNNINEGVKLALGIALELL